MVNTDEQINKKIVEIRLLIINSERNKFDKDKLLKILQDLQDEIETEGIRVS